MNMIDQKRKEVGLSLATADEVQEAFSIFGRCWGLLRNFYNIGVDDDAAWEVVAKEGQMIGELGNSPAEKEIAVKMAVATLQCLEILSKAREQKEPA